MGDPLLRSGTRHRLGQIYFSVGEYRRAIELLRESVDLLGELAGTADELGYVLGVGPQAWLGYGLAFLGEFQEAISFARQALRLAEAGGRPGDLIVSLGALGAIYLVKGDHRDAIQSLERGLALCQRWGILDWSPTISSGLALAHAHEGRLAAAITLHQRAEEEEARGTQGTPTTGFLRLCETYLLADRVGAARACAERALSLSRTAGERSSEARALRLLGEVEAGGDQADVVGAERLLRQALLRSEEFGLRPHAARCHLSLGVLYVRTGRREQSQGHLATALAMFREMEMTYWLQKVEAEQKMGA